MSFDNMHDSDVPDVPAYMEDMPPCAECGKKMPFGPHLIATSGAGACSITCYDLMQGNITATSIITRASAISAASDRVVSRANVNSNDVWPSVRIGRAAAVIKTGENPKHAMGVSKVPILSVVPTTAITYIALAMRYGAFEAIKKDGSLGYGPYNWRETKIYASVYADAAMRHIMAKYDGEDLDADSGVDHLGHAMACLALWADAQENGTLVDDRPTPGNAAEMFRRHKKTP